MSILALAFLASFALVLVFVVASAARRGGRARVGRDGKGASPIWFGDGGASFSDSGTGADCSGSDGGGSCDGGGGGH